MPLYLVRWPTLVASLVQADDEEELLDLLDQEADPGGCTFELYEGPLWIDFQLPFTIGGITPGGPPPADTSELTVEATPDFDGELNTEMVRVSAPSCDFAADMLSEVLRGAFPGLSLYLEELELDPELDPEPDATNAAHEGLSAALREDLAPMVRYLRAQSELATRDDFEANLMKDMGVTTMLPSMRRGILHALKETPALDAD